MTSRCAAFLLVLLLAACGQGAPPALEGATRSAQLPSAAVKFPKIHHVVIIFQENRSVDDLFNGLPGADTVRSGVNSKGQKVDLQPIDLSAPYDLGHKHSDFTLEYDGGKLDGFDRDNSTCQ